jgi:phage gp29-like protein
VLLGSDAASQAARDYYKTVITNIHRNQDEGIIMPSTQYAPDDGGGKMYDITLLGPSSQRQFMTDQIINRYNKLIAMTVLADFLMLGQDQTGSYALAETRNNIFSLSITAILDSVADVINSYAVPRLARLNADINPETLPKLTHGDVASSAAADVATAISNLARGGVTIPDSVDFRNKIWNILHLPTEVEPEEESQRPEVDSMLQGETAEEGTEREGRLNEETPAKGTNT